ncbi:ribosome recycling factor [candidate division Kazan bacterium RBG_13_50_9]|uniref:Ribosome-recycling factor n=1 Tax=candidate division Kazan bacterium RBG_13_50_9 TaxID=1798535 RepID=A0A1F4NRT5_UNCK3|nr:MAG: ribosome recycling factor [candidate division Kazan bacterium RBG_13_50_9]
MDDIKHNLVSKINSAREYLMVELVSIRSGGANASLLDKVLVEAYDQKMPVGNLATVTVPDPKQLLIQPWDKANTAALEKAIAGAGLGLSVVNEGDRIRVVVPPLSNERREELAKLAYRIAEDTKVSIRNARREALEAMEARSRQGGLSDDDKERLKKEYQALVDAATKEVEQASDRKAGELRSM